MLPANQRSMVIYEYVCRCDSRYIGRTNQRLQERIKQHVPKAIREKTLLLRNREPTDPNQPEPSQIENAQLKVSKTQFEPESDSAIDQHLLISNQCARNYSDLQFKILTTARSQFHLSHVEAIYILRKKNRFVQAKAVRIYSLTVSIRSEPAVTE